MDVLTDGYALPVSGGLYPPPPYLYRGATAIIASYEADPAAIADLLPPGVSPLEDPPSEPLDDDFRALAPRSFLAQPDPLKWIVGAVKALRTSWLPQIGQLVGPASLTPCSTSKRCPLAET